VISLARTQDILSFGNVSLQNHRIFNRNLSWITCLSCLPVGRIQFESQQPMSGMDTIRVLCFRWIRIGCPSNSTQIHMPSTWRMSNLRGTSLHHGRCQISGAHFSITVGVKSPGHIPPSWKMPNLRGTSLYHGRCKISGLSPATFRCENDIRHSLFNVGKVKLFV
jgi:hypothetical protein